MKSPQEIIALLAENSNDLSFLASVRICCDDMLNALLDKLIVFRSKDTNQFYSISPSDKQDELFIEVNKYAMAIIFCPFCGTKVITATSDSDDKKPCG